MEAIQLFDAQEIQINYTKVHFANAWGSEDEGVKGIVAKLNSMQTFLSQKLYTLQNRLASELSPRKLGFSKTIEVIIEILQFLRLTKTCEKYHVGVLT